MVFMTRVIVGMGGGGLCTKKKHQFASSPATEFLVWMVGRRTTGRVQ